MNNHSRSRNNEGFTLIEVIISIAILAFISYSTYQAINQTYRIRDVLINEGEFFNTTRLAINLMGQDFEMLYSPWPFLPKAPSTQGAPAANPTQVPRDEAYAIQQLNERAVSEFWHDAVSKQGVRPSRFIGKPTEMKFISANTARFYRDSKVSIFSKVTYFIREDTKESPEDPKSFTLFKKYSTRVFEGDGDKDPDERVFPLLKGIESIHFRYSKGGDNLQWQNEWDTAQSDTKQEAPRLLQVEIVVNGPVRLKYEGKLLFRTEIPRNETAKSF